MRFPGLTYLFHRRAKSDTVLAALPPLPMAPQDVRPVPSASFAGFTSTTVSALSDPYQHDAFTPFVAANPYPLPVRPSGHATAAPIMPHLPSPQHFSLISAQVEPPDHAVLVALAERNRELDNALQRQYDLNRRIPFLESSLATEREAHAKTRETISQMTQTISILEGTVSTFQSDLVHAPSLSLTAAPSASRLDDERVHSLAAENAKLTEERTRHRKFIELMISVGGHKPVLDQAYQSVATGTEPEEALVAAIKAAMTDKESVWAQLAEPIVGPRTQEEYKSQVACTLRARKETRDWKKRAKFWKRAAKTSATNADTVTPSPSDVSSVAEPLSKERQKAVDALQAQRRAQQCGASAEEGIVQPEESSSAITLPSLDSRGFLALPSAADTLASSAVLPQASSTPTATVNVRISTSSSASSQAYPNLAPLASESFRLAHAIQSIPSRASSLSIGSITRSISGTMAFGFGYMFGMGAGAGGEGIGANLTPSASGVSSASRESRRRAQLIAVGGTSKEKEAEVRLTLGGVKEYFAGDKAQPLADTILPSFSEGTSDSKQRVLASSPEPEDPLVTGPDARSRSSLSSADSEELVMVMHSDLDSPTAPTPASEAPATPSPSTPDKKSRLPVLRTFKAMRRISISRPVLVNTTNAATFTFAKKGGAASRQRSGTVSGSGMEKGPMRGSPKRSLRERAPTVVGGSPPRPSKIPMGQRIGQFARGGRT